MLIVTMDLNYTKEKESIFTVDSGATSSMLDIDENLTHVHTFKT